MSFPEAIADLIRQGRQHHAEVTGRFIQALEEHRGCDLDADVAALPPVCRAMAEQIVSEARSDRASDDEIARAALLANDQCDANARAAYDMWLDANGVPTAGVIDGRSGDCF